MNRTRPIVSYKEHGARKLGRIVARALSVLIKKLTVKYNSLELFTTNDALKYLVKSDIVEAMEWALNIARKKLKVEHFSIAQF